MRYELTDNEWSAIKPMLPNKPRGVPRVNDRRVLNGIFWVLRSGAPWRDLPDNFGPYTTCYNRFVRWRRADVWAKLMSALAGAHDAAVQMIDTSIVRVHQQGACVNRNRRQSMGRSRGGLTSKIHAVVDTNGLPVRLALTAGEAHDNRLAGRLLSRLKSGAMLLADRGYDADWIRTLAAKKGAWANIPPRCNRNDPICFSPYLYRARNLVERFFNKIKQCRRVATRYDKLAANYLAFVQLASIRLWLRVNESGPRPCPKAPAVLRPPRLIRRRRSQSPCRRCCRGFSNELACASLLGRLRRRIRPRSEARPGSPRAMARVIRAKASSARSVSLSRSSGTSGSERCMMDALS
jgi:transposase